MGIKRGQPRRARIALAATVVALATAGSAAAFQALPPGGQVNNDVAAGINPALSVSGEDPTNADVVGGALDGRQAGRSVGDLPPAGDDGRRPDLRALVRGRRVDDARQRHGRRALERRAEVRRLAELRPGPGWRGALDRLRRCRAHRAVGDLVREHDRHRLRRQQRVRQPLRQHGRRQPGQVDLRRPGPRHRRRAGPTSRRSTSTPTRAPRTRRSRAARRSTRRSPARG